MLLGKKSKDKMKEAMCVCMYVWGVRVVVFRQGRERGEREREKRRAAKMQRAILPKEKEEIRREEKKEKEKNSKYAVVCMRVRVWLDNKSADIWGGDGRTPTKKNCGADELCRGRDR